MVVTAQATGLVHADPQQILELVIDLERYSRVDTKIKRVGTVTGPDEHGVGSVGLWGKIPWLPPAPDRQDFVLRRWTDIRFVGAARQPGRLVFDFTGVFECEPMPDGTTSVRHAYEFLFKGPFKAVESRLAPWLQQQITDEVASLANQFPATPGSDS